MTDIFRHRRFDASRPDVVTSTHTLGDFFDSLQHGTTVTVDGYAAPTVALDNDHAAKDLAHTEDATGAKTYQATVHVNPISVTFYVTSIVKGSKHSGEDFVIRGHMNHEEDGNYYGVNRWTTNHAIRWDHRAQTFKFYDEPID